MRKGLDEELIKKIIEMRDKGATFEEISKKCNIAQSTAYNYAKKTKRLIKIEKGKAKQKKKLEQKVIKMREEGATFEEIAKENNIGQGTAHLYVKKNGIQNKAKREQEKKIIEMRKQGKTYKEIEESIHVSMRRISYVLKQNDLVKKINRRGAYEDNNEIENENHARIIKQMMESRERVDTKFLKNVIETNYEKVTIDELKNTLKIYTRQGEVRNAISLINSLIGFNEEYRITKKDLEGIKSLLEEHKIRISVIKELKENKSTRQIAQEMRISEIVVARIKREWEEKKSKQMENNDKDR